MAETTYSYTRTLTNNIYDLDNPNEINHDGSQKKVAYIIQEQLPGKPFKLFCDDTDVHVVFENALTAGEETTLNTIISDHKARALSNIEQICVNKETYDDYAAFRKALKDQMATEGGYASLSDTDKKIMLYNFGAGAGNDYVDPLFSQDDHGKNFKENFKKGMDDSRQDKRDKELSRYFSKDVYQGNITQANVLKLISDTRGLRLDWANDGVLGVGYGDSNTGLGNFIQNDNYFAARNIVAVDITNDFIEVARDSQDFRFLVPSVCGQIQGSTGNDGYYTIKSIEATNGNTKIYFEEDITDSTVDGTIIFGLKGYDFYADQLRDDVWSIINEGQNL